MTSLRDITPPDGGRTWGFGRSNPLRTLGELDIGELLAENLEMPSYGLPGDELVGKPPRYPLGGDPIVGI